MKKLKYGMVFLALVGIGMVSCEKEEIVEDNSTSKVEYDNVKTLSPTSDVTSIAQAANLKKIEYVQSSGNYTVTSYDYSTDFEITVDYFNVNNESVFTINDVSTNTDYEVTLNTANGTLDISGIGEYSAQDFSNGISSGGNIIVNIAAVFAPYHEILGNATTSFSDNGDNDSFGPVPGRPFIGTGVSFDGPCNELLHTKTVTTDTYFFWVKVGSNTTYDNPC